MACEGCREDQPNQLAHMGVNGCLSTPLDRLVEGGETDSEEMMDWEALRT